MSIKYCSGAMPTSLSDPTEYLCLFPIIGLKKCGENETYIPEIYKQYPHSDYYVQHNSTGKRAKPATFERYPSTQTSPGIINLYVKVYPGSKAYPNDNSFLRIKNFGIILQSLSEQQGIKVLHMTIPSKVISEQREYINHIEDYITTCKLNGRVTTVHIYGTGPINKAPQATGTKQDVPKVSALVRKPAHIVAPKYILKFEPTQLNDVVLYEADFVQGTVGVKKACTGSGDGLGVLKYLNDPDGRWSRIIDDTKLLQEAIKVEDKIGDIIGNADVFPPKEDIFNALSFLETDPKVILIGQDPYHGPKQSHGLSFSVPMGVPIPPSLRNIYSAMENDPKVDFKRPKHGCLVPWAKQGVVMLNSALTVVEKQPKSHSLIWSAFTDRLIHILSVKFPNLIFVLWGGDSKKKRPLISGNSHVILEFNHPSPTVRNNTFGTECRHFSQINEFLVKKGQIPIDWRLT